MGFLGCRLWRCGVHIVDEAMVDLCGLGIVGHPATIDDELVGDLVSPWNEDGCFKTIRLAGEPERGRPLYAEMWCGGADERGKAK